MTKKERRYLLRERQLAEAELEITSPLRKIVEKYDLSAVEIARLFSGLTNFWLGAADKHAKGVKTKYEN